MKFLVLSMVCAALSSCAMSRKPRIVFNKNTWIVKDGQKGVKAKAGDEVVLQDEPIILSSPDRSTIIVVPPVGYEMTLPVHKGRNLSKPSGKVVLSKKSLDSLLSEMSEIQFLVDQSALDEALTRIRKLKKRYYYLGHLSFLEASTLVLLGKDKEARKILAASLKGKLKDPRAFKLYESLSK